MEKKVEFKIIDLRRPTKTSGDKMDLREPGLWTFVSKCKHAALLRTNLNDLWGRATYCLTVLRMTFL